MKKYKNAKKVLLSHIQDVLEDKYISLLVDKCTNILISDILTILEHLFYNFGRVWSEEVSQKEMEVIFMI